MCSGDVGSDGEKPMLRSLKELTADFERRRPRPVMRSLRALSLDFSHRKRCAAHPQALRSLEELAADFRARRAAPAAAAGRGGRTCDVEAAACQELPARPAYGRDELLAVLACMQLGPLGGRGRGAGIRTSELGAPPGLEPLGPDPASEEQQEDPAFRAPPGLEHIEPDPASAAKQQEDPALDAHLLALLEAWEARETWTDRDSTETFGPHAEVVDARVAEEDEAYLASLGLSCLTDEDLEAWALQPHLADEEAFEAQDFWWNAAAMEQQCYAEDMWDFNESSVGYENSFWGYPQDTEGFQVGLMSSDMYFGLADKSRFLSMAEDPEDSTAPTEKESDGESGGEEAELLPRSLRQAICW